MFTEKMVANVDMLGAFLSSRVIRDLYCCTVVFIYDAGFLNVNAHSLEKHVNPDKFLNG